MGLLWCSVRTLVPFSCPIVAKALGISPSNSGHPKHAHSLKSYLLKCTLHLSNDTRFFGMEPTQLCRPSGCILVKSDRAAHLNFLLLLSGSCYPQLRNSFSKTPAKIRAGKQVLSLSSVRQTGKDFSPSCWLAANECLGCPVSRHLCLLNHKVRPADNRHP